MQQREAAIDHLQGRQNHHHQQQQQQLDLERHSRHQELLQIQRMFVEYFKHLYPTEQIGSNLATRRWTRLDHLNKHESTRIETNPLSFLYLYSYPKQPSSYRYPIVTLFLTYPYPYPIPTTTSPYPCHNLSYSILHHLSSMIYIAACAATKRPRCW